MTYTEKNIARTLGKLEVDYRVTREPRQTIDSTRDMEVIEVDNINLNDELECGPIDYG